MRDPSLVELVGFGPEGWGAALLTATGMTLAVAIGGFAAGSVIGAGVTSAKLSRNGAMRAFGGGYTTVLRGIPDLLVIYLFYFGGSAALGAAGRLFGAEGFIGMPAFITGVLAIGVVSGAYQAEVFRGAFNTISRRRTGLRMCGSAGLSCRGSFPGSPVSGSNPPAAASARRPSTCCRSLSARWPSTRT